MFIGVLPGDAAGEGARETGTHSLGFKVNFHPSRDPVVGQPMDLRTVPGTLKVALSGNPPKIMEKQVFPKDLIKEKISKSGVINKWSG